MTYDRPIRQYFSFEATADLQASYAEGDVRAVEQQLLKRLGLASEPGAAAAFSVVSLPSLKWRLQLCEGTPQTTPPKRLVVSIAVRSLDDLPRIRAAIARLGEASFAIGSDLAFHGAEVWCPGEAADPLFADRAAAERLIGVDRLRAEELSGRGVNVVVIDQGLDARRIPNFAGGWTDGTRQPGATPDGHGTMVARNVISIVPDAAIFDCPLIPPAISAIPAFLSDAEAAFGTMMADIERLRRTGQFPGPWIFVNAWAVYDRESEQPPADYTENPEHPFNTLIGAVDAGEIDAVFAAGNCGQFCPNARCGADDRGPGHSIFGANSHPKVLTVGAVRADMLWLGYSSQGPGQPRLAAEKPDVAAPSHFREAQDSHDGNTGSSTACALTAGVIAALRGRWRAGRLAPAELRALLRRTARPTDAAEWNGRLGHGIVDAAAACEELATNFP